MGNRHSNRAFQARARTNKLAQSEVQQQEAIAHAQALGQAFASATQYRVVVEQMIAECFALNARLPKKDPAKAKLAARISELNERLTAAHAFVIHCGDELLAGIPLNPADPPRIAVPDPAIVTP